MNFCFLLWFRLFGHIWPGINWLYTLSLRNELIYLAPLAALTESCTWSYSSRFLHKQVILFDVSARFQFIWSLLTLTYATSEFWTYLFTCAALLLYGTRPKKWAKLKFVKLTIMMIQIFWRLPIKKKFADLKSTFSALLHEKKVK